MSLKEKTARARTAPAPDTDLAARIAELEAENRKVKLAYAELEAKTKTAEVETAKRVEAAEAKARTFEGQYTREKLLRGLRDAATAAGALDPEDVAELALARGARLDGEKIVIGADAATAKEVGAYLAEYLAAKPHHARAKAQPGTGSPTTPAASTPAAPAAAKHDTRTPEGLNAHLADEAKKKLEEARARRAS